jgi:hypothetical protein
VKKLLTKILKILKEKIRDYKEYIRKQNSELIYLVGREQYLVEKIKKMLEEKEKTRMNLIAGIDAATTYTPLLGYITILKANYELLKSGTGILPFSEFKKHIEYKDYEDIRMYVFKYFIFYKGECQEFKIEREESKIEREESRSLLHQEEYVNIIYQELYESYLDEVAFSQ